MKIKTYSISLVAIFFLSCTTLQRSAIENMVKQDFQALELKAGYDPYHMRIDIIRQTEEVSVNDSTNETKDVDYHSMGFHLGNGLFYDLNDNLSLLVPELFGLNLDDEFLIEKSTDGLLFKHTSSYSRKGQEFIIDNNGLLNTKYRKHFAYEDSSIVIKRGHLFREKITLGDNQVTYQTGWGKRRIIKDSQGYYLKTLLGKINFSLDQNTVNLGKRYKVRLQGNTISISAGGLLKREYLLYKIEKSAEEIFIYSKHFHGKKIIRKGQEISVYHNSYHASDYLLKAE